MQTFRLRQFEYATKNLKFSAIFKQSLNVLNSYKNAYGNEYGNSNFLEPLDT